MKKLLHVGCGFSRLQDLPAYFSAGGWSEIRFDIDPGVDPDVVGDVQDLSIFDDGTIDAVYSSHNIEHVSSFQVPVVLREFRRVLRPDGVLVLLCPDMLSVAEAIVEGRLEEPLYVSPAGPITAIDVVYGFQADLQRGRHYMAHKMAFTPDTLAGHVLRAGFTSATVLRDRAVGLTALCCCKAVPQDWAQATVEGVCLNRDLVYEGRTYGSYGS